MLKNVILSALFDKFKKILNGFKGNKHMKHIKTLFIYLLLAGFTTPVFAASLLSWDFENPSTTGSISTFNATMQAPEMTGFASQTGGGPSEVFTSRVHLTRFLGTVNYPYIEFTNSEPLFLQSLQFDHFHNHNTGFPTNPSYDVQLQIDDGTGFVDVGNPLNLSSGNYGTNSAMLLDLTIEPGTYQIRWVSRNLAYGTDTNTEFFAMDNLVLNGVVQKVVPTLSQWAMLSLILTMLALGLWLVRRRTA